MTRRGQLKGISQKKELAQVKDEIQTVSRELKQQTIKLGRQLHDTPDTADNTALIKTYRLDLINLMEKTMEDMNESQSCLEFKSFIEDGNEEKDKYGNLKILERQHNDDIKKYQDLLKKNNEDFAAEAQ